MSATSPPAEQFLAHMGQDNKSAERQTVIDLLSDNDSWSDWANPLTINKDSANESVSSDGEGSLFNEEEGGMGDGHITHTSVTMPDYSDAESSQSDIAPSEKSLPSSIRALLDEWYIARGRHRPPPCAVHEGIKNNVNRSRTGAPAVYLHKSGEVLELSLHRLPECAKFGQKFITTAQGQTEGPFVISYVKGKTGGNDIVGFNYFVWEGVRAKDPNGWEDTSSVRKRCEAAKRARPFQSTNSLAFLPRGHKVRKAEKIPLVHTSSRRGRFDAVDQATGAGKSRHEGALSHGNTLPNHITDTINAWHLVKGTQSLPPFITHRGPEYLKIGKGGRPAHFVYEDGSPLNVTLHTITIGERQCNVAIANGANLEPSIIRSTKKGGFDGNKRISTLYRVWVGLSGDANGFAKGMPVTKCFEAGGSPKTSGPGGIPPPSSSHKRNPVRDAASILGKHSRSDSSLLLESVPRKDSAYQQKRDSHIMNNAIMLFYAKDSDMPRIRPLNACTSVEKLFAQASAGDVFEQHAAKIHVLSIRLQGLERAINVVEGDEDDFEKMIEAVKTLQCWREQAGDLGGSCTVEVRARI